MVMADIEENSTLFNQCNQPGVFRLLTEGRVCIIHGSRLQSLQSICIFPMHVCTYKLTTPHPAFLYDAPRHGNAQPGCSYLT